MKYLIGEMSELNLPTINKLTVKPKDTVLLVGKTDESVSVHICKAIADKNVDFTIVIANTVEEICFELGKLAATNSTFEFFTDMDIPSSIKNALASTTSKESVKRPRTTRGSKKTQELKSEPVRTAVSTDKPAEKDTAEKTVDAATENTVSESVPADETETDDADTTKVKIPFKEVWMDKESPEFYSSMCKYRELDRDSILPKTAEIFATSKDVNEGLKKIKRIFGDKVAADIAQNANLLMAAIKDGYNKKVDKIEY